MEAKLLVAEHAAMASEQIGRIISLVLEHKINPEQAISLSKELNTQTYGMVQQLLLHATYCDNILAFCSTVSCLRYDFKWTIEGKHNDMLRLSSKSAICQS